jgi:hypothetical protein
MHADSAAPSPARSRRSAALAALLALAPLLAGCEPEYTTGRARSAVHAGPGQFRDRLDFSTFQRGSLHTHTSESDGDHPPEDVAAWYRDHGYNFVVLSDHNKFTDPERYRQVERRGFVLVGGEEVSLKGGGKHVHINAICTRGKIGGRRFGSVEEALRWGVRRSRQQGGVALINHPNFYWAFGAREIGAGAGASALEIWSGHPKVYPEGDWRHPSVESMWDAVLTAGMDIGPAAVDDMHRLGAGRDLRQPGPGRGWVDVFARHAGEGEICDALRRGWFSASNGVRLSRITVSGDTFVVQPRGGAEVEFIGDEGRVLDRQSAGGRPAVYRLRGGEGYVRARVTDARGARLWTPAFRVGY